MLRRRAREFFILPAEPDDIEHIARLHTQGFARGWTSEEISDLMARPEVTLLAARPVGDREAPIAGFNLFRQTPDEAEILSIAVDSKARRLGIGEALMRASILALRTDRVKALLLEVDEANTAAVTLYRRLGFVTVGQRPGYYTEGHPARQQAPSSALVMRLDLV